MGLLNLCVTPGPRSGAGGGTMTASMVLDHALLIGGPLIVGFIPEFLPWELGTIFNVVSAALSCPLLNLEWTQRSHIQIVKMGTLCRA